jgi:hypothetical protein
MLHSCAIAVIGIACSGCLSEEEGAGGMAGQGGNGGSSGAGGTRGICTSQSFWTGGDKGSEIMHPGGVCLSCHATDVNAPKLAVAGTVYPTLHELVDCNGRDGTSGIAVIITDATGQELPPIPVNEVGNFRYEGVIAAPFQAKVVSNGKENRMSAAQTIGECNGCHTKDGANGAPGRILAP